MDETQVRQLADEFRDSYRVLVDGPCAGREQRFIAIARQLGTSPYAVVTPDPDELRVALTREQCHDDQPTAS
jgi:hypothetical protein